MVDTIPHTPPHTASVHVLCRIPSHRGKKRQEALHQTTAPAWFLLAQQLVEITHNHSKAYREGFRLLAASRQVCVKVPQSEVRSMAHARPTGCVRSQARAASR